MAKGNCGGWLRAIAGAPAKMSAKGGACDTDL